MKNRTIEVANNLPKVSFLSQKFSVKLNLIPLLKVGFMLCLISLTTEVLSQQKYEKESRIKGKNAPINAINFVNSLGATGKIKWYLEENLDNKSVEAKFKFNKKRFSIEFDTSGLIQDVEIKIDELEIESSIKSAINFQLDSICSKYKIKKIQVQYAGSESVLLSFLKNSVTKEKPTTKYEIVAKCKSNNKTELIEYLFSANGQLLEISKIVFKNSSNLEY